MYFAISPERETRPFRQTHGASGEADRGRFERGSELYPSELAVFSRAFKVAYFRSDIRQYARGAAFYKEMLQFSVVLMYVRMQMREITMSKKWSLKQSKMM